MVSFPGCGAFVGTLPHCLWNERRQGHILGQGFTIIQIVVRLGGSNDVENLRPDPYDGTDWTVYVMDRLGEIAHEWVCNEGLPLAKTQEAIPRDWIEALFMGPAPTSVDAVVFPLVENVIVPPFDSPIKTAALDRANLVAYAKRMRARYFA